MKVKRDNGNLNFDFPETLNEVASLLVKVAANLCKTSTTEEDLRIGFERQLIPLLEGIGVPMRPQYEKTILKQGWSDAIHGQVIIEYEKPEAFRSNRWVEHAKEQLVRYIIGETKANKSGSFLHEPKMIGIGFDGEQIFYVHYAGDKAKPSVEVNQSEFRLYGPYKFEISNARTLISYIRLLVRKLLSPESLSDVFEPRGKIAPLVVSAMIDALENWDREKRGSLFYNEWKRLFGIVYGEQFEKTIALPSSALSEWYKISGETDFSKLLFAVHTYFAFLMKLIAAELLTFKETSYRSSLSNDLALSDEREFRRLLNEIENGGIYAKQGVTNFLEGDFFSWYLDTSSPRLTDAIRTIAGAFTNFEPSTPLIYPEPARDLLKRIYQFLVPPEVRHSLGEYYTPDWLAELIIEEIGYDGDGIKRVLDPACGSGTFLVFAIQKALMYGQEKKIPELETAKRIKANIWGFDLNPLAVVAARTNYLLALGDLVDQLKEFEIPVYLADSVLWPERRGQTETESADKRTIIIKTSLEKPFHVPAIWVEDHGFLMKTAAPIVEHCVKSGFDDFIAIQHLKKKGCVFPPHEEVVSRFYNELLELEIERKNGIWARFIKNIFAPVTAGKFDYVIGNPPWIRWGYLSNSYREATLPMWKNYGLFSLKGHAARLGAGEKDFSMLFTYVSADYYLKNGGKLGFLITQEVFKSKGAGEGFRRFQLGDEEHLKVIAAHDFVTIQPFEGATNKTGAIIIKKGEKNEYPIPYFVWSKRKGVGHIPTSHKLEQAIQLLIKKKLIAKPIDGNTGSWLTIPKDNRSIQNYIGSNHYEAKLGARVEPYGVFWLELVQVLSDSEIIVRNMPEKGKRIVKKVTERIELDLVYPAVRGADIRKWLATPNIYVLLAQDPEKREPYPENLFMTKWPRTFSYLLQFKDILETRGSKTIQALAKRTAFYAMFGIGPYTMANYKVVWKRMTKELVAAVISQHKTPFGFKTIIPTDTTSIFACDSKDEAHFLCAIINSGPIGEFVKAYSSAGRGFGAPSVMEHIRIPKFDPLNELHMKLVSLSITLHDLAVLNSVPEILKMEQKVNECTIELFG